MTESATPRAEQLELTGRLMSASNATFTARHTGADGVVSTVVYKPIAGERPLWDFPDGRLADREVAAYLVSEATGWQIVPRTWLGEGPHGEGMIQQWIEVDPTDSPVDVVPGTRVKSGRLAVVEGYDSQDRPVTLVHEDSEQVRRIAVFDAIINNADRKGGHVLGAGGGVRYGIDHGVCFHTEPKLRTVLWGWAGSALAPDEVDVIGAVRNALDGELGEQLGFHLAVWDLEALVARCERLLEVGVLPVPSGDWHTIPWPPM